MLSDSCDNNSQVYDYWLPLAVEVVVVSIAD
jgi:hypothetical protein